MRVTEEEMRVVEKMAKLNPGIIKCPSCGGPLKVHHWKREGKFRVPFFKCACGFLG
jgi:ssDNA-binding Zn-finger/Zn-ribbon topoisomerase 1